MQILHAEELCVTGDGVRLRQSKNAQLHIR